MIETARILGEINCLAPIVYKQLKKRMQYIKSKNDIVLILVNDLEFEEGNG